MLRVLGRKCLWQTRFNSASVRFCSTVSRASHEVVHARHINEQQRLAIIDAAYNDGGCEATLRACGQVVALRTGREEHLEKLQPLVSQYADSDLGMFYQANCFLCTAAKRADITVKSDFTVSGQAFQSFLSKSEPTYNLTSAFACLGILHTRLLEDTSYASAQKKQSDQQQAGQFLKQLTVHFNEEEFLPSDFNKLLNWWATSATPGKSKALMSSFLRCLHRHLVSVWSMEDSITVVREILCFPHFPRKDLIVKELVYRCRNTGLTEDVFRLLFGLCHLSRSTLVPETVDTLTRKSLRECLVQTKSVEFVSEAAESIPNILKPFELVSLMEASPDLAWSDASMPLLALLRTGSVPKFADVIVQRAETVSADGVAELLSVCQGTDIAIQVSRQVQERFPIAEMPGNVLMPLLRVEVSNRDPVACRQVLSLLVATDAGLEILMSSLESLPVPCDPAVIADLAALFVRQANSAAPSQLPHLLRTLEQHWHWLPAAEQTVLVDMYIQHLPHLGPDEIYLGVLSQVDTATLSRFMEALNELVLGFIPADACRVAAGLLIGRLYSATVWSSILDYVIGHLDLVPDEDLVEVLRTVANLSGYCHHPLTTGQVDIVQTAVDARLSSGSYVLIKASLAWAMSVNNQMHGSWVSSIFKASPRDLFKEDDGEFGHMFRRLLQIYEHYEKFRQPTDMPLAKDIGSRLFSISPVNRGYRSVPRDARDGVEKMMVALTHLFPAASAINVVNFGGVFIIVNHAKAASTDAEDSGESRDEANTSQQPLVFTVPRISRFMHVMSDTGELRLSGDMLLTLRNLERVHGCKSYVIPCQEWLDTKTPEERIALVQDVISGQYDVSEQINATGDTAVVSALPQAMADSETAL